MNFGLDRAASVMKDFPGPWGIAGGWAIDLFLQRESRAHADIDVAVLRADQRYLRSRLSAARVEKVIAHRLSEWLADDDLQPPIHEVHATWPDGYHVEFLLNEHDPQRAQWHFRRDPRIHRPLAAAFPSTSGIPYLAPEIVLLYKSKAPGIKDDADLLAALPHLQVEQRAWLHQALVLTEPGHRWADVIAREP